MSKRVIGMKRRFFLLAAALFFSTATITAQTSEDNNSVSKNKIRQNVEVFTKFNTMQDYEPSFFSATAVYNLLGPKFSASGGIFLQKGDTQLTVSAKYKFYHTDKLSLGTGVTYNLNVLHKYSISNNFLPGFYLDWQPKPFYSLEFDIDFLVKFRSLFVFSQYARPLVNTTMGGRLKNTFYLPKDISLYIEFASIEDFRYMIFCAPSFIFGSEFTVNEKFDIGVEAAVHYIDFFTLSAHYEDTDFRLGVRYKW